WLPSGQRTFSPAGGHACALAIAGAVASRLRRGARLGVERPRALALGVLPGPLQPSRLPALLRRCDGDQGDARLARRHPPRRRGGAAASADAKALAFPARPGALL